MSGTKRISGALAAVAMTGLVLGACVSPGAGLGAAVRDENHLPAAVVPAGRDTDKLAGDAARSISSLVQGGGAEREAIKQAAARVAEQAATTSQEAQANNQRAAAEQAAAQIAEQAAVSQEAWASAQRAAAQSNSSSAPLGPTTRRMLPR